MNLVEPAGVGTQPLRELVEPVQDLPDVGVVLLLDLDSAGEDRTQAGQHQGQHGHVADEDHRVHPAGDGGGTPQCADEQQAGEVEVQPEPGADSELSEPGEHERTVTEGPLGAGEKSTGRIRPGSRRSTSNANVRGSTYARRRRKEYLLRTFDADLGPELARCVHCGCTVGMDTISPDRIVKGVDGGRYVRDNIQPSCLPCNVSEGGAEGGRRAQANARARRAE